MKGTRFFVFLCCFWAGVGLYHDVRAQVFRRVTADADIEVGARYVFAAPVFQNDYALFVVTRQEATGTGVKNRAARQFDTDEYQRIHVDDDSDIALFELGQEGTAYTFRDVHNGGFLTYSTKKTSESKIGLYTMTEEDVKKETSSSGLWYRTFRFDFSLVKTCLTTAQTVSVGGLNKRMFLLSSYGISDSFSLYAMEQGYGYLYLYKELASPVLDGETTGDWNFRGDWTAEGLSAKDYSKALRIDFTGISLPEEWNRTGFPASSLPGEYVWTYVRQGEGARLPKGWCNVIEISSSGIRKSGCAVTAVKGGDACVMAPKYPFRTAAGYGISWLRDVPGDGGWLTAGFPFAVQHCTWECPEGEEVKMECREFYQMAEEGAVFREVGDDASWEAGKPYLWRPVVPVKGTACFHADVVDVQVGGLTFPEEAGFYTTFMSQDLNDDEQPVYLLDESGKRFVRAAAGSRITAGRGFLYLPGNTAKSVRLSGENLEANDGAVGKQDLPVPVYTPAGIPVGEWTPGTAYPASLPRGIYVTPYGKWFKP